MNKTDKLKICSGCYNNFYNHPPHKGCWNLPKARKVRRWRIGWWTPMDKADNFYPVTTLSCFTNTGHTADYERLPQHLGGKKPPTEKQIERQKLKSRPGGQRA